MLSYKITPYGKKKPLGFFFFLNDHVMIMTVSTIQVCFWYVIVQRTNLLASWWNFFLSSRNKSPGNYVYI